MIRHLHRFIPALLVGAVLGLPTRAVSSDGCPTPATWQGQGPPTGTGYFCGYTREDGELVRHGWAVLFHPQSQAKSEECEYREGIRHGRCTLYDEKGQRSERGSFDQGVRTSSWWFWSLPSVHGRRESLTLVPDRPGAARERRGEVESFLNELGARPTEASALAEALLSYVDHPGGERRQICGEHLCLGPGKIPHEAVYIAFNPTPEQVARDRELVATYESAARTRVSAEERAEKLAQRQQEAEERQRAAEQRKREAEQRKREALERKRQEREQETDEDEPDDRSCCRICSTGKPCGDSCIASHKTCRKGRGCAC